MAAEVVSLDGSSRDRLQPHSIFSRSCFVGLPDPRRLVITPRTTRRLLMNSMPKYVVSPRRLQEPLA